MPLSVAKPAAKSACYGKRGVRTPTGPFLCPANARKSGRSDAFARVSDHVATLIDARVDGDA